MPLGLRLTTHLRLVALTVALTVMAAVNADAQRARVVSSAGDSRNASWVHEIVEVEQLLGH